MQAQHRPTDLFCLPLVLAICVSCADLTAVTSESGDGGADSDDAATDDKTETGHETCGNGKVDPEEECDPSASGESNETWRCSNTCQPRRVYVPCDTLGAPCLPDPSLADSSPELGTFCANTGSGAGGVCLPASGLDFSATHAARDTCPAVDGPFTQKRFYNVACVIECEFDADAFRVAREDTGPDARTCPSQIPHCVENPFRLAGPHEATRMCVP